MKNFFRKSMTVLFVLSLFSVFIETIESNQSYFSPNMRTVTAATLQPSVTYSTHIQSQGWQKDVKDGKVSGTTGLAKRLEGIKIDIKDTSLSGNVEYRTHVQKNGWMDWKSNNETSGTTGESKRLEAIEIRLTGELAEQYDIYYRVHAEKFGWLNWAKNSEPAGTEGYAYRLEAIEIKLVKKGEKGPSNSGDAFKKNVKVPSISYQTHVQSVGWQGYKKDGQMSGTSGLSKRLEGIKINLSNLPYSGGIKYRTHVQKNGWMNWKNNNAISGTTGESKRLEAIEIELTGDMAKYFDVYYRVHAQTFGWLGWAKNGESAGSSGYAKRLEGIEMKLVKKGDPAPGSTSIPYKDKNVKIEKKTVEVKEKEVGFKLVEENDDTLELGKTKIIQEGKKGYDSVKYEVTYTNGKETSRKEISRNKVSSIDKVIKKGTKIIIDSIKITEPIKAIKVGENIQLSTKLLPENATDKTINWATSDTSIATIDKNGLVTAVGVGTVTLTVNTKDGNKSDSIELAILPINVESITLDKDLLTLTEGEINSLVATVLPENATEKNLIWTSSDESVVQVDSTGKITALKAGEATVLVSTTDGNKKAQTSIKVIEPTIVSIEDLTVNLIQNDSYSLPKILNATMSNGTIKEVSVNWDTQVVNTSNLGTLNYKGTVDGYDRFISLTVIISKYEPNLSFNTYSSFTINGLSQSISMSINNLGSKDVKINKIEIYESGVLYNTLTAEELLNSNIPLDITAGSYWGITSSSKLGMWVNNSYVKYYVEVNNTEYEFTDYLD